MTVMSSVAGAGVLAHGLHAAMVLLGLWGLVALLLPQALEQHARRSPRRTTAATARLDEHAHRVAALRAAAASGTLATLAPLDAATSPAGPSSTDPARPPARALSLPLVLVAGTAAAGIHAAVAPLHLREDPLSAGFFLVVAAGQLWWISALVSQPRPGVLRAGIRLNAALIALWLLTRLVGLPFGLLSEPHPVGSWDVTCVGWQLIAIVASAGVLRDGTPARLPGWFDWHPSARAAVGAAAVLLVLLAVTGAHA